MLELNHTQAKIIRVFIDNYRDKSNKISIGISGHELEKYGIVSKTFRNHKEYFLKNYFLRLSATGYHGGKNYYYFQITRFGIIAYMKWIRKQKAPSEFWLDKDFFPLIWKHWEKLVKIYGEVFDDIIQEAMTYLEIGHQYVFVVRGEEFSSSKITEVLTIPIGKIHIKTFTEYPKIKPQDIPTDKDWGRTDVFKNFNQKIDNKIAEKFTFLVYYALLEHGLAGDFALIFNHVLSKFLKKNITELDLEKSKREIILFTETMKKNTDELFTIIRKDKKLHKLMKSTLVDIKEVLKNRKPLDIMIKQLG